MAFTIEIKRKNEEFYGRKERYARADTRPL